MNTVLASTTAQFAHLPFDWVVAVIVLVIIAIDAFRSGTARATAIVLASIATITILTLLQSTVIVGKMTGSIPSTIARAVLEDGIWVLAWILSYRIIDGRKYPQGLLIAIPVAVAAVASILVVWVHSATLQSIWQSSVSVQTVFGAGYALYWLVASYVILAIARS